jgi:hypothetical protein
MSRAAVSAKVFAIYLFFTGAAFVLAPNMVLSLFKVPPSSDVWIHVLGVLAFMIGIYAWVAAKHEIRPFFAASVYTRAMVCAAFTAFVAIGLASPVLALFGVIDLIGGVWTHLALKADARAA